MAKRSSLDPDLVRKQAIMSSITRGNREEGKREEGSLEVVEGETKEGMTEIRRQGGAEGQREGKKLVR